MGGQQAKLVDLLNGAAHLTLAAQERRRRAASMRFCALESLIDSLIHSVIHTALVGVSSSAHALAQRVMDPLARLHLHASSATVGGLQACTRAAYFAAAAAAASAQISRAALARFDCQFARATARAQLQQQQPESLRTHFSLPLLISQVKLNHSSERARRR